MATQSFDDRIKGLIKQRLNPDTEDLIRRKADADAEYYGSETTDFDRTAGVEDPFQRRRLVDSANQRAMASSQSLGGALDNRETGIGDIVNSFSKARAEENQAQQQDFQNRMEQQKFALAQQSASQDNIYRNAQAKLAKDKELDPTDLQREFDFIKRTQGEGAAKRWLDSSMEIPKDPNAADPNAAPPGRWQDYIPAAGGVAAAGVGAVFGAPLVAAGLAGAGVYGVAKSAPALWAAYKSHQNR